jgi:transcriptional regulator of acetoin/glycerol metabolism
VPSGVGGVGVKSALDSCPEFIRVKSRLESYAWPGNVRELENIIERIMVTSTGGSLNLTDLFEFREFSHPRHADSETLDEVEKSHIIKVVVRCKWQIEGNDGAAKVLDVHPSTLRFKIKKLGIQRPEKYTSKGHNLRFFAGAKHQ